MKLNQNSFSAKIYRWFFMRTEMPSNLCPYFWKLVLAFTLSIPVLMVTLIYQILYFRKHEDQPADSPSERFFMGLFMWVGLYAVFTMLSPISLLWLTPEKNEWIWTIISTGIVLWIIAVIIGVVHLFKRLKEKRDNTKWKNRNQGRKNVYDKNGNWIGYEYKEPKTNILIEFIKAKYNKYCPKIDWK